MRRVCGVAGAAIAAAVAAAALIAGCASRQAQADAAGDVAPRSPARSCGRSASAASASRWCRRSRDGVVLRRRRATARCVALQRRHRRAIVWRASAGGALSRRRRQRRPLRRVVTRGNELVTFEAGREVWRKRAAVARRHAAAGGRRARLRDGRRPRRARLRRARRPAAVGAAAPGRRADAGAAGRASPPSRTRCWSGRARGWPASTRSQGTVRWEVPMAAPRGTNEVERLADLIGPAVRVGEPVCARAFQAAVALRRRRARRAAVDAQRRRHRAVGGDAELVVGADASDRISAWRVDQRRRRVDQREAAATAAWARTVVGRRSRGLRRRRGLRALPGAATGEPQLRLLPTDGSAGAPVVAGGRSRTTTGCWWSRDRRSASLRSRAPAGARIAGCAVQAGWR